MAETAAALAVSTAAVETAKAIDAAVTGADSVTGAISEEEVCSTSK